MRSIFERPSKQRIESQLRENALRLFVQFEEMVGNPKAKRGGAIKAPLQRLGTTLEIVRPKPTNEVVYTALDRVHHIVVT